MRSPSPGIYIMCIGKMFFNVAFFAMILPCQRFLNFVRLNVKLWNGTGGSWRQRQQRQRWKLFHFTIFFLPFRINQREKKWNQTKRISTLIKGDGLGKMRCARLARWISWAAKTKKKIGKNSTLATDLDNIEVFFFWKGRKRNETETFPSCFCGRGMSCESFLSVELCLLDCTRIHDSRSSQNSDRRKLSSSKKTFSSCFRSFFLLFVNCQIKISVHRAPRTSWSIWDASDAMKFRPRKAAKEKCLKIMRNSLNIINVSLNCSKVNAFFSLSHNDISLNWRTRVNLKAILVPVAKWRSRERETASSWAIIIFIVCKGKNFFREKHDKISSSIELSMMKKHKKNEREKITPRRSERAREEAKMGKLTPRLSSSSFMILKQKKRKV